MVFMKSWELLEFDVKSLRSGSSSFHLLDCWEQNSNHRWIKHFLQRKFFLEFQRIQRFDKNTVRVFDYVENCDVTVSDDVSVLFMNGWPQTKTFPNELKLFLLRKNMFEAEKTGFIKNISTCWASKTLPTKIFYLQGFFGQNSKKYFQLFLRFSGWLQQQQLHHIKIFRGDLFVIFGNFF